ncbi:MAG: DUF2092 domain-containing protein [Planctomycetes bacterium]|nr:DUF2092 domain-containing protein [Planctomycetota bacterium]
MAKICHESCMVSADGSFHDRIFAGLQWLCHKPKGVNAPQSSTEFQNDNTSSLVRFQVETHADRLLLEMGDYLKSADTFTFHAESSYDAIDRNGQKIRYRGTVDVALSRPNRVRSAFNGDERQTQTFYDGKTVTIYNAEINMYAVSDVPPDIGDAIDMIVDKYEVSFVR